MRLFIAVAVFFAFSAGVLTRIVWDNAECIVEVRE